MALRPSGKESTVVEGPFSFNAVFKNKPSISETYRLQIKIPATFPRALPVVFEMDNKIPRTSKYHVNPDGTLCLGSPLRLILMLSEKPTLVGFADLCMLPYLYAVSIKMIFKIDMPLGELSHGKKGLLSDYKDLFGLNTYEQVEQTLRLLNMSKKRARKEKYPCGCGKPLRQCSFNAVLKKFHVIADPRLLRDIQT